LKKKISDQLIELINSKEGKEAVNKHKYATLVFKIKDGKIVYFEKHISLNLKEINKKT